MKKIVYALVIFCYLAVNLTESASNNQLETCKDEKEFKNLLKTKPNLLILFGKNEGSSKNIVKLLKELNSKVIGIATIAFADCSSNKKLCKKLKVEPNPVEIKHYNNGQFNKDYDRSLTVKSLYNFLLDPTGDLPWEEEETAQDVIHISDEASFNKLLKKSKNGVLVMFYAAWCGYCKKLKPDYSKAASQLKSQLAAVNCDLAAVMSLKNKYNITGFPMLKYFKNGKYEMDYGGENNFQSLVDWMANPTEPKPKEPEKSWADEDDVHVTFLTDKTFDDFIATHKSVLVKFYAPWCGHCKNMKPVFNSVARTLKEEKAEGIIAFVDCTVEKELASRFDIKGFPTIKFFQDGEFAWDYSERDESKILSFMRNPQKPEEPKKEPEWKDEVSYVVHAEDSNFESIVKTKKHALGFFYAPWCGHCKTTKPIYTQAAEHFKDDIKTAFLAIDCTKEKAVCEKYGVKSFPTIIYFNFGKNPTPYEGLRGLNDFISFMKNPNDPNAGRYDAQQDWLDLNGNEHMSFFDDKSFEEGIKSKARLLVLLYAPWCGHCKRMKPDFAAAAIELKKFVPGAYLAAVDMTKTPKLGDKLQIAGFPTIQYYENGVFKFDYNGGRTKEDFVNFMKNPVEIEAPKPAVIEDVDWTKGHEHVNMLTDSSFDDFVSGKKVLVMFYAPWCGHCKSMKKDYGEAASEMKRFLPGSYLAAVDCTKEKSIKDRFKIEGFPTLKYFENGKFLMDYSGDRSKDSIVGFMKDRSSVKTEL